MRILSIFIVLCSVLMLSACTLLSPMKVRSSSSYTITDWPKQAVSVSKTHISNTLLVSSVVASPGYDSSRMIYVLIPYQLKSYANHRWVAPPAELLLPLIANHIRAKHYFHAVVTSPFSGAANNQLNIRLLTLQQEFLQPQSKVRLVLQATLINAATGNVVATRLFEITVPASSNDPYSGVLATNRASGILADQIANFVVSSVKGKQ